MPMRPHMTTVFGMKEGVWNWLLHNAAKRCKPGRPVAVTIHDCQTECAIRPGVVEVRVWNVSLSRKEIRKLLSYIDLHRPMAVEVLVRSYWRQCPGCVCGNAWKHICVSRGFNQ